ncbi:flagellar biosynthetic protein FliO [Halomonas huangheensis]|uniref:Flagellar protein n=1 Tax=Halomonas huangheensis TaxID=1178482 RepID=W1N5D9_9GAMM|nr:flagellar biosynthetic protein FliO [Halomonas huangheensis]ALM54241.1 hypothetical protein AR456_19690 [Halomonas huangheensis]ERL50787.1 hypothetical protein BJB45_19520 [Halomonas huangheensis]
MSIDSSATINQSLESLTQSGDNLLGMAMLGKTAAALAVVLLIILGLAALVRRRGLPRQSQQLTLKVIGSTPIGPREKVVVVQVEDRWLVLGVGGNQITRLDSLEAREEQASGSEVELQGSFAERFAQALKANLSRRGTGS